MICPKCGKEQASTTECSFCGIIFEKYEKRKSRVEADSAEPRPRPEAASGGRGAVILVGGAVVVCVALLIYLVIPGKPAVSPKKPAPLHVQNMRVVNHRSQQDASEPQADSIKRKLLAELPPRNSIEAARNATVLIRTAWGTYGAGFFIDDKCDIVTNRHVVALDDQQLEKLRALRDNMQKTIEYNRRKIKEARSNPDIMAQKRNRDLLEEKEKEVDAHADQCQKLSDIIETANSAVSDNIRVFLADGTELPVQWEQLSDRYDLALLTVLGNDSPFIRPSPLSRNLMQGQKLFTVGNPDGMQFTVTGGIFSGYRDFGGMSVLQTDAPVNPGNSGGPLLDENGRVVGVNTAKLAPAENIGFAIPFAYVRAEFGKEASR